jgi:hypothetical protein
MFDAWRHPPPPGYTVGACAGLYTLSKLLRTVLPRGFHRVVATHNTTGASDRVAFTGINKFTVRLLPAVYADCHDR